MVILFTTEINGRIDGVEFRRFQKVWFTVVSMVISATIFQLIFQWFFRQFVFSKEHRVVVSIAVKQFVPSQKLATSRVCVLKNHWCFHFFQSCQNYLIQGQQTQFWSSLHCPKSFGFPLPFLLGWEQLSFLCFSGSQQRPCLCFSCQHQQPFLSSSPCFLGSDLFEFGFYAAHLFLRREWSCKFVVAHWCSTEHGQ